MTLKSGYQIKTVISVHVYSGFLRKCSIWSLVFHYDPSLIFGVSAQRVTKDE